MHRSIASLCHALSLALGATFCAHAQQPAVGDAVSCKGLDGSSRILRHRPDPAYHFFTECEPVPAPPGWKEPAALQAGPRFVSFPGKSPARYARAHGNASRRALPITRKETFAKADRQSAVIDRAAMRYGLDRHYLTAIMHVESAFNPDAVSPVGATGLMQLMPATARRFGVTDPRRQLRDPETNVDAGAQYISYLRDLFKDDWYLITAAYNAGEGAVRKYGNAIPPYNETQNYVRSVEQRFEQYRLSAGSR